MQTRIFFITGSLLLLAGVTGCKKVIERVPDSVLTTAQYFKNAKDIDLAVIGVYSSYQSRKQTDYMLLELPTDNLYRSNYTLAAGADDMDNLSITPSNPLLSTFWSASYAGIARANAVLSNIDNPGDYKTGQKEQFTGEAKFMRALFYFDLVRLFGGVPAVTSQLSIDEAKNLPRASEEEIYTLIINDLKEAAGLLPDKASIAKGRASNGAAAALLAKVYVYRKDWPNAKTYLDQVNGMGYGLLPSFANIWKLDNEDNNEMVFVMKYVEGTNGQTLSSAYLPFGGIAGIATSGNESAFPSWDLLKLYDENDSRKAATIESYYQAPTPANAPLAWLPHVSKYQVKHVINSSGLDLPVIRYADLVLLMAEVQYGLQHPDLAVAEINKIRERAFGSSDHNYTVADISTDADFTDKILLERRLELAYENERWFDLVRTNRLLTELSAEERSYNIATETAQTVALAPKANYSLLPVPQTQIDIYPTDVLTQNPGY